MAARYHESYRGERGYARDERGFDPRVSSELRPEFDEEESARQREAGEAERRRARQADRLYRRDYGPYDYGWASERPWAGPFTGRGPKGYQRSDTRIREDVCDRLTDAPFLDASDVEVVVTDGDVTLAGTVPSREQKRRSEDLIEHVTGVREVHNNLRVNRALESTNVGP
jgi:hypothetical protein